MAKGEMWAKAWAWIRPNCNWDDLSSVKSISNFLAVAWAVFYTYSANGSNINSSITMLEDTKVTSAVDGCHGKFTFYQ